MAVLQVARQDLHSFALGLSVGVLDLLGQVEDALQVGRPDASREGPEDPPRRVGDDAAEACGVPELGDRAEDDAVPVVELDRVG